MRARRRLERRELGQTRRWSYTLSRRASAMHQRRATRECPGCRHAYCTPGQMAANAQLSCYDRLSDASEPSHCCIGRLLHHGQPDCSQACTNIHARESRGCRGAKVRILRVRKLAAW